MNARIENEVLAAANNQLLKHTIQIHKFGGSSLASTQCINRVVEIIKQHCQLNDVVVVSANGGTTDALFSIIEQARAHDAALAESIKALELCQHELITALLNKGSAARLLDLLQIDIEQLKSWISEDIALYINDILAFGEVWSARLLSAVLNQQVCPSHMIDARDFLRIDNEVNCNVDFDQSTKRFQELVQPSSLTVVTGYISRDAAGLTKTLGRNGSDYSATIMAAITQASNVTLWTDVDGIYSADPRMVSLARKLHRLPNGVARELGRLGNPVLHAKTLKPLEQHATHLHVASSFAPEVGGTEIGKFGQIAKQELSVTFLNDLLLVRSEGLLADQGKHAAALFDPICFDSKKGVAVIRQEQQKSVSQFLASSDKEVLFKPVSILATVGHKVATHGSVRARFRRALKTQEPIDILPAESKHSLIAILARPCSVELLNNIHHDMTKDARTIGLVVAGLGNIGKRFIEMLPTQLNKVEALENVHLVGLVTSKKALINNDGIDVKQANEQFERFAQTYDNELLLSWLKNHPYDELIVVDNTPSEEFSALYPAFFKQSIHVIGANKWAASSDTENYENLLTLAKANHSIWLGNTTVGAGLPVNYAIKDLLNSGDEIREIAGIFSGTLSWLFQKYDAQVPFSTLMKDALAQGLTEPDPREDLSGRDVQRKLLILARLAGYSLQLTDIEVQNLVPESLRDIDKESFLAKAERLDDFFLSEFSQAKASGLCIRYVARFANNGGKLVASVGLEHLPENDAFANLSPCDNIFQITSDWYCDNPLIIRGPGAGRDVTAGGLHSDLVAICQQLSNRSTPVKIKGLLDEDKKA
ncbi:bifunctional aspartate kinase/homoserine dehydrogenase II [Thalassotalea fusca]